MTLRTTTKSPKKTHFSERIPVIKRRISVLAVHVYSAHVCGLYYNQNARLVFPDFSRSFPLYNEEGREKCAAREGTEPSWSVTCNPASGLGTNLNALRLKAGHDQLAGKSVTPSHCAPIVSCLRRHRYVTVHERECSLHVDKKRTDR
jgi:hypothetical protein